MNQYHKIYNLFEREDHPTGKDKRGLLLKEGVWKTPEFEILKDIPWLWTEKIDGTNIRILWDGQNMEIRGKSDNAQLHPELIANIQSVVTPEKLGETFGYSVQDLENPENDTAMAVCLYGEGYGAGIQKGGGYRQDKGFILFDIKVGDSNWLDKEITKGIADKLGIEHVIVVGKGTLLEAVSFVKTRFKSFHSIDPDLEAEGLVVTPAVELRDRFGGRIIAKIKVRDFEC